MAVTVGPGLSLCLDVGVRKAREVSRQHSLPLVPVHHMEVRVGRLGGLCLQQLLLGLIAAAMCTAGSVVLYSARSGWPSAACWAQLHWLAGSVVPRAVCWDLIPV